MDFRILAQSCVILCLNDVGKVMHDCASNIAIFHVVHSVPQILTKAKCKTLGASVMYIVYSYTYMYIHGNMHTRIKLMCECMGKNTEIWQRPKL